MTRILRNPRPLTFLKTAVVLVCLGKALAVAEPPEIKPANP